MPSYLSIETLLSCPDGLPTAEASASFLVNLDAIPPALSDFKSCRCFDVAIAIDVSMSMYHVMPSMVQHLERILDRLPDGSLLTVWTFARDIQPLMNRASVNIHTRISLKSCFRSICCRGGTNLELPFRALAAHTSAALQTECAPFCFGVILTDGQPMAGIRDPRLLSEILPDNRTNHMLAYSKGADCWVAKEFGKRSPKNTVKYCTSSEEVEKSLASVFPSSTAFVVTDVEIEIVPLNGTRLCTADVNGPLSDVVQGVPTSVLVEVALPSADHACTQSIATVRVSYFDGEFVETHDVTVNRYVGRMTMPPTPPLLIRAAAAKRKIGMDMNTVQDMLKLQRREEAAKFMRSIVDETQSMVKDEIDAGSDHPLYRSLRDRFEELDSLSQILEASVEPPSPSPLSSVSSPQTLLECTADDEEEKPVFRSLGTVDCSVDAKQERSPFDSDDFMHRLVCVQNATVRA